MNTQTKRKLLLTIWMGCSIASTLISVLFKNLFKYAGKVSFVLAVIGIITLIIGIIYEVILYYRRKKERSMKK